ncbi:MAG: hypothetical protein AAFS10_21360, partial [Myxococcota bacterium]
GEPPHILTAALSGSGHDWSMRVVVPGASMPKRIGVDADGVGVEEVLCRQTVGAGPVRIEVAAREGSWPSDEGALGAYRLKVDWRQAQGHELEPNSDLNTASTLPMGRAVRGVSYPAGDIDVYVIEVSDPNGSPDPGSASDGAGRPTDSKGDGSGLSRVLPRLGDGPPGSPSLGGVSVEIRAVGEQLNPVLVVLDPDGIELARSDRRGLGEEEVIRMDDLPTGRYFVRLEAGAGTKPGCDATYTLKAARP